MTEILPLWADALDQRGDSLLSRAEKVIMIILSGLGAGYWGYGLLLYLTIPGEYKYWFGMEMGFGVGLFLLFEVAILKKWINRRLTAWVLFFIVIILAIGSLYLIEALFQPRSEHF